MVTGELPFGVADPVRSMMLKLRNELPAAKVLAPDLSERVDWAIRRAMSADPNQRPASCREFVEDLTGQSTRMDEEPAPPAESGNLWHAVYNDTGRLPHTASGTADELRKMIQGGGCGELGDVRLSRSPEGPFSPLDQFPEFRDLVVQPASGPALSPASAANLAKRSDLVQGGERVIETAPARAPVVEDVHVSIPMQPKQKKNKQHSDSRAQELLRILLILILGVSTAFLAVKFLFPLLHSLR
jgi:hypothetical protein